MIDREGQRMLWTGESTDCICGHHLEHHYTLDNGSGFCTRCADSDSGEFYHNFVARRQPLMEVRELREDYAM